MFPELELAYRNSIDSGILGLPGHPWIPSWLRSRPIDRSKRISLLPDNLRRFAPRDIFSEILGDKEFMQYLNNIPEVIRREISLRDTYDLRQKPGGWRMTNPVHHDPSNFRYLVHSHADDGAIINQLRKGNPQELKKFLSKKALSCSIIDELTTGTYRDDALLHGFILDIPEDDVIAIDYKDMGKPDRIRHDQDVTKADIYEELAKEVDLRRRTPQAQTFMKECNRFGTTYNEVIVNGGDDLKVTGIYLLTDPFLNEPLYEIYSRLTAKEIEHLQRLQRGHIPLDDSSKLRIYGEPLLIGAWRTRRYIHGYAEARDLARILNVPLVPIRVLRYSHQAL